MDSNPTLYPQLENECLYNGQWKHNVLDWGCTGNIAFCDTFLDISLFYDFVKGL